MINRKYGKLFQEHLLEQYKLYVSTSLDVSSKRAESNKFYLAVNSAIFGFASYLTFLSNNLSIIFLSMMGILVSYTWYENILSYKELNSAKFKVIHGIEKHLPASLFEDEEENYLNKYHGLTLIENRIPKFFIVFYIFLIGITILRYFGLI